MTDDIKDPIAKAKMVALKGIKRVLTQDPMNVPPGINRYLIQYKTTCCHALLQEGLTFMQFIFIFSGNRYHFWPRGWLRHQEAQTLRPTLVLDHLRSVIWHLFCLLACLSFTDLHASFNFRKEKTVIRLSQDLILHNLFKASSVCSALSS